MTASWFADEQRQRWFSPALIAALVALLYVRILSHEFAGLDNDILITDNAISHGLTWTNIKAALTSYDPELYIPFTFLSYQINWSIAGAQPWIYHLTNLLLHAANAVLVSIFVHQLTERRMAGVVAGILFAVHPLHVEAVAWPAARKDLLMAVFFLASLISFLHWQRDRQKRQYRLSLLLFLLSLLSKATSIVLPGVLFMLLLRERRSWKNTARVLAPFIILSFLFGVIAIIGKTRIIDASPPLETLLLSFKSTAFYLGQLIAPMNLSPLYPQTAPVMASGGAFLLSFAVVAALVALLIWAAKRSWMVAFAIGFFFLLLLPNFLNFYKNGFLFFASDRYAYLPSIGLFLLIGSAVDTLIRGRTGRYTALLCFSLLILLLAWKTNGQVGVWRNHETLYRSVIARYPINPIAWNNLGVVLMDRGDLEEALPLFDRAAEQDPHYVIPFVNKGHIFRRLKRGADAERAYQEGIARITTTGKLRPYDLLPYRALADYYRSIGRRDLALQTEQRAQERIRQ